MMTELLTENVDLVVVTMALVFGIVVALLVYLEITGAPNIPDDVSYCRRCGNVTHVVNGRCGKCGRKK